MRQKARRVLNFGILNFFIKRVGRKIFSKYSSNQGSSLDLCHAMLTESWNKYEKFDSKISCKNWVEIKQPYAVKLCFQKDKQGGLGGTFSQR